MGTGLPPNLVRRSTNRVSPSVSGRGSIGIRMRYEKAPLHLAHSVTGHSFTKPCIRPELPLRPFSQHTSQSPNSIIESNATASTTEFRLLGADQRARLHRETRTRLSGTRTSHSRRIHQPNRSMRAPPKSRGPITIENGPRPCPTVPEPVASSELIPTLGLE